MDADDPFDEAPTGAVRQRRLTLVVDLAGLDLAPGVTEADLTRHVDFGDAMQDPGVIGDLARAAMEPDPCL